MSLPRITFNAPVTLSFFFLASLGMVGVIFFPMQVLPVMAARGPLELSVAYVLGVCIYPFAHADWLHFVSNFSIILLIGPVLEEKYSSRFLFFSLALTSIAIGVIHTLLFDDGIIGASGLVFFAIMLVSMTNFKKGEIPMSLILVALLYLGKEVAGLFEEDQVSQFGHILGGVCGTLVGYWMGWGGGDERVEE